MSTSSRLLCYVALLGATLGALGQWRPSWAAARGFDWWSLPELREEVRQGEQREAELSRVGAAARIRLAGKRRVTRDLLAGRLTLTEAAARFRDIDGPPGDGTPHLEILIPGATQEERFCREVIGWAASTAEAAGDRGAGQSTRARLEAQLKALLEKHHGGITLPD